MDTQNENENKKPNFARSAESVRIETRLAQLKVGEMVTYSDLNNLAPGLNVQGADRCKMYSAMRACMGHKVKDGEPGYLFGCVTDKGIKRLDNRGIAEKATMKTKHIRRASKRTVRELKQTHYESLTADEQQAWTMQVCALSAMHYCSKETNIKKLGSVASTSGMLSVGNTLEAFTKLAKNTPATSME